jgi:hypothetical protein
MNEDIHLITFMCACFCLVIIVLHLSRQRHNASHHILIFFRSLRMCCRGYDVSDNTPSHSLSPRFCISIPQRTTPARRLSRVTDKETRRYFILTNMIHKVCGMFAFSIHSTRDGNLLIYQLTISTFDPYRLGKIDCTLTDSTK